MKILENTTQQKNIIDRDDDVTQISDYLKNAICTQVHTVYAQTGYGKSFFTEKLARENQFSDWDIIRICPIPKNTDSSVPEGNYLDLIFETMMTYFNQLGYKKFYFESYLISGHNKLLEKLALTELIDELPSIESKHNALFRLIKIESKRRMKIGIFNPSLIINDNSPISRNIKADYIRFLFNQTRILLIIENIQNIDYMSIKYLLDWINETKDKKHGFVLEYTISDSHDFNSMKTFQNTISKTGVQVFECELEKMPVEYIADVIDSQLEDHPSDIHFTIDARKHYEEISNGNLWDLIDFARVYDKKEQIITINTPTLSILKNLSQEAQYLFSILACHNGTINNSLLKYIWSNYFSNKSHDYFEKKCLELLRNHTISIKATDDSSIISVSHASILDVWQSNKADFILINKDTYNRLKIFYEKNYSGDIHIVTKQNAWQMLAKIYSYTSPKKIEDLLNDFKLNIMRTISRSNTWSYLKMLVDVTCNNIDKFENTYYQILQICCSASLYEEGFYCIRIMEHFFDIEKNKNLLLNKVLYLSILDKHDEAIKLYNDTSVKAEMDQETLIKIKLLILNSYIVKGDIKSCRKIDKELNNITGFKKLPEYAIYLRLTNIYTMPSHAVKDAKRSIHLFHKQGNYIQEGKSYITYSKLLSSMGKHKKAIKMISIAEQLLIGTNDGLSCIYNNLAGYLLLSGVHGSDVWNYLDIAEIYSVSTYDKLSVIQNKLAWCYENDSFIRLDLLENKALELIELEPSRFLQCTTLYNLYITMKKAGLDEKANMYFSRVLSLKDKCSYVKARLDGITWKTRYIKPRLKKPYHICYLSFWVFDL